MTTSQAMTIAVEFEIRQDMTTISEWIETWEVRAKDALDHEPMTTAYEAATPMNGGCRVLVLERYEGGEDSLHEHMERAAHKALLEKMRTARMTRRRPWIAMGYEVEDVGWRFNPHAAPGTGEGGAVLSILATRCADSQAFVESRRERADHCLSSVPGTFLYGLSSVSVDDRKDFDLREGDFVTALAFKDVAAYESRAANDLRREVRDEAENLGGEILFSLDYLTTGCGFLWKGDSDFVPSR